MSANRLKPLVEIPTLSMLYKSGKLSPSTESPSDLPKPNQTFNDTVCTLQYNITKLEVDAIVNAANRSLLGGGGVDGAIHSVAGEGLYYECRTLRGCDTGSAKITDAYDLPCKKVIHAVGPIYSSAAKSEPLLRGCYKTSLQLAVENDLKSIAFSGISTGIYGYPSVDAAKVALREVRSFLSGPDGKKIDKIIFCSFSDKDVNAYERVLPMIFPATKDDVTQADQGSPPKKEDETAPEVMEDGVTQDTSGELSSDRDSPGNLPTIETIPQETLDETPTTHNQPEDVVDPEPSNLLVNPSAEDVTPSQSQSNGDDDHAKAADQEVEATKEDVVMGKEARPGDEKESIDMTEQDDEEQEWVLLNDPMFRNRRHRTLPHSRQQRRGFFRWAR